MISIDDLIFFVLLILFITEIKSNYKFIYKMTSQLNSNFISNSIDNNKNKYNDAIFDITVMHSSLLRGTNLDNFNTSLKIPSNIIPNLNKSSLINELLKNLNLTDNNNNNSIKNLVHYLNSKKLKLLIFRKSRSKNCFYSLYSFNDFNSLKSILKIKHKLKFIFVFVKVSTISKLGFNQVKNSILEKLSKDLKIEKANVEKGDNNNNIIITKDDTVSINNIINDDNINNLFEDPSNFSLPSDQFDYLINSIKSYIDPSKFDKNLSILMDCISDLKNNLSNNFEPLNQKIDNLYSNVLNIASNNFENLNKNINNNNNNNNNNSIRSKITHSNVLCDGCDKVIVGYRFKCIECNDYDLCEICDSKLFESNNHLKTHQMIRIILDEKPLLNLFDKTSFINNSLISNNNNSNSNINNNLNLNFNNKIENNCSFKLYDSVSRIYSNDFIHAMFWIEGNRYLNIDIETFFFNSFTILLSITFKNDIIPKIEHLEIKILDPCKIISIDPFNSLLLLNEYIENSNNNENLSLDLVDFIYLSIKSDSEEYLFEPDNLSLSSTYLTGNFKLIKSSKINLNESISIPAKSDLVTTTTTTTTTTTDNNNNNNNNNIVTISTDDINDNDIFDVETINDYKSLSINSNLDDNSDSETKSLSSYDEKNIIITPRESSNNCLTNSLHIINENIKHEFELLGYYLLDFNTNELEVRIRTTIPMESSELISLSISDFEGVRFTSELTDQGNNILIARFLNWNYSDLQLEIKEAIVHYKAHDYDIISNKTKSPQLSPSSTFFSSPSSNYSSSCNDINNTLVDIEKSELKFPQFDSKSEAEYVFISRTASLVDENESDYSVLSMDES